MLLQRSHLLKIWGVAVDEGNFPDPNFREHVAQFDKNKDFVLSQAEIADVTTIDVNCKNISSLQGIEYFTNLVELSSYKNKLAKLDVSGNTEVGDDKVEKVESTNNIKKMSLIYFIIFSFPGLVIFLTRKKRNRFKRNLK